MMTKTCEVCGVPLPKGKRAICGSIECKRARENYYKSKAYRSVKLQMGTRRKLKQEIPYNRTPCRLCKEPLGKTLNHWFHVDCHKKVSHLEGIEYYEINAHQRNGHHAAN